jgi:hypothetical protein
VPWSTVTTDLVIVADARVAKLRIEDPLAWEIALKVHRSMWTCGPQPEKSGPIAALHVEPELGILHSRICSAVTDKELVTKRKTKCILFTVASLFEKSNRIQENNYFTKSPGLFISAGTTNHHVP